MALPKPLPPIDDLRDTFSYDPDTGLLTWRTGGGVAGVDYGRGWLVVSINGRKLKVARVCYALGYGEDPYPCEVDHINRIRNDNRLANLRRVTNAEQAANKSRFAQRRVRVVWPDGRGSVVTDSQKTAARVLGCSYGSVLRALRKPSGAIMWRGDGPRGWVPSGIRVEFA